MWEELAKTAVYKMKASCFILLGGPKCSLPIKSGMEFLQGPTCFLASIVLACSWTRLTRVLFFPADGAHMLMPVQDQSFPAFYRN